MERNYWIAVCTSVLATWLGFQDLSAQGIPALVKGVDIHYRGARETTDNQLVCPMNGEIVQKDRVFSETSWTRPGNQWYTPSTVIYRDRTTHYPSSAFAKVYYQSRTTETVFTSSGGRVTVTQVTPNGGTITWTSALAIDDYSAYAKSWPSLTVARTKSTLPSGDCLRNVSVHRSWTISLQNLSTTTRTAFLSTISPNGISTDINSFGYRLAAGIPQTNPPQANTGSLVSVDVAAPTNLGYGEYQIGYEIK